MVFLTFGRHEKLLCSFYGRQLWWNQLQLDFFVKFSFFLFTSVTVLCTSFAFFFFCQYSCDFLHSTFVPLRLRSKDENGQYSQLLYLNQISSVCYTFVFQVVYFCYCFCIGIHCFVLFGSVYTECLLTHFVCFFSIIWWSFN